MCGQSEEWHRTHFARHPYTPPNGTNELRDTSSDRKAIQDDSGLITRSDVPFDPVLRLALIEAGVITTQQLDDAHKKFKVVMAAVNNVIGEEKDG
jgi:hypothetical protein